MCMRTYVHLWVCDCGGTCGGLPIPRIPTLHEKLLDNQVKQLYRRTLNKTVSQLPIVDQSEEKSQFIGGTTEVPLVLIDLVSQVVPTCTTDNMPPLIRSNLSDNSDLRPVICSPKLRRVWRRIFMIKLIVLSLTVVEMTICIGRGGLSTCHSKFLAVFWCSSDPSDWFPPRCSHCVVTKA